MAVSLKVNGAVHSVPAEPDTPLLYVLRNDLGLNAAKFGCGLGQCGTCTVLVDGGPVSACTYLACEAQGHSVLTVEGFAQTAEFAEFENAFMRHAALQCGYCTPGLLLTLKSLRDAGELRSDEDIRHGLDGSICRCTGYRAILAAARELAGLAA